VVANESAAVQSKINLKAFEASNSGWAGVYSSIFSPRVYSSISVGKSLWIGPHTSIRVSSYYYIRGRVCG